jgi:protein-L-isoaspartate O-methyltransferase
MSVRNLVQRVYNLVRPILPKSYGVFNGVKVKDIRIFDRTTSFPEYEAELCAAIDETVEPGMDVTVVGGGRGVSTVRAARIVGDRGTVTVYEGSEKQVTLVEDTVQTNNVASCVDIRHAVVAGDIDVYTDTEDVPRVDPADLTASDALILDCEGAEIAILSELEHLAEVVVVETHDQIIPGATAAVRHILENRGYEISTERNHGDGIQVLAAVRRCS